MGRADPAGTSLEWDFDGNIELGVVGLHVPPVLVSELLKDLADLRLVWPLRKHHHFDGGTFIHRRVSSRNPIKIDRHVEDG